MKRLYLNAISSAALAAMMSAPLAMAQQPPQHPHNAPAAVHASQHETMAIQHNTMAVQHNTAVTQHNTWATQHNTAVVQHDTRVMQHDTAVINHDDHNYPARPQNWQPPHVAFSGHYWHHGDHFYGNRVYVTNWQWYNLNAPPPGYAWVQDGDQFVLVAVASGIIADVTINAIFQ